MEYETYGVDECNYPVKKYSDCSEEEIQNILDSHPEYSIKCIPITKMDDYDEMWM